MSRKIGFIAIGETIVFNGIKAVAVDAGKRSSCKGCIFCDLDMLDCPCTMSLTDCYFVNREDHKNIEFKLAK